MDGDDEYISEEDADPKYYSTGDAMTSGQTQTFACPSCGSHNTAQGTYFEECRSCGWSQGY